MNRMVSKSRARKTRSRDRKARERKTGNSRSLEANPLLGLSIAFLLWAAATFILEIENIVGGYADPASVFNMTGNSAFLLVGLFAAGLFLNIASPKVIRQNSRLLLLGLVTIIAVTASKALYSLAGKYEFMPWEVALFLLPLALAPLLTTILVGSNAGIGVGVWTSFAVAIMDGRNFSLFLVGIVATAVAAQTGRDVRTRYRVFRTGLVIGLAETTCLLGLTALGWQTVDILTVLRQAGACLVGGFFSAVVVLLILPLFEMLFNITTDITLLELSDMGHPLLQRLAMEAPGTYHHSLVVASLAQSAADTIGANSLLARVAAYFHDVGKLTKPDFFVENIRRKINPHDSLPPSMSTLVITSHVKEGMSLAILHKLPAPVVRVLREHHGTSLLSCFHHKARNQLELDLAGRESRQEEAKAKVDENDFRYPGPKPISRESGIICLADAVEAASRTMEKPTPNHIEELVDEITNTRFEDGQLDECELTLSEITKVRKSFVFTLTNMLHGRVPYPKNEDRNKQQPKNTQSRPAPDARPPAPADAQGNPG
ncbi:MAG: HDIG domain-containing protein [Kiritimatiellia bacterium]